MDFSAPGYGLLILAAALIPLFVYLHKHAETFREENRVRRDALRTRLASSLMLDFVIRSFELIVDIVEGNEELAEVREQLAGVLSNGENSEEILEGVRETLETYGPTATERRRMKDFTQELLERFEERDRVSTHYEDGWKAEDRCARRLLTLVILFGALGLLLLASNPLLEAASQSPFLWGGLLILGAALAYVVLFSTKQAIDAYQEKDEAQRRFLESASEELYEIQGGTLP